MMTAFYQNLIEEAIRPLVKLLRDNGFNTTCSCGHNMYVEMEYYKDCPYDLYGVLINAGYKNFKIELIMSQNEKYGLCKYHCVKLPRKDGTYYNEAVE